MPFNRAWLILPSKRVQQQKQIQKNSNARTSNQYLSSSLSKVVLNDNQTKSKRRKNGVEQKRMLL